jgi:hypothetical protein
MINYEEKVLDLKIFQKILNLVFIEILFKIF